jgi:hypothetical protein
VGARYNHTREITLAGFVPDPDPNVTPPAKTDLFSLDHVQFGNNPQHGGNARARAHAIFFSLEAPETAGGSISFTTWERDDKTGGWSALPPTTTAARKKLVGTGIESATIFVQVTAVSGYGAATKLKIHVAEQSVGEDPGYGADVVMGTVIANQGTSPWVTEIQEPISVEGLGTAGSPAGGVLTVQGDPAGEPVPVTGTTTSTPAGNATSAVTSVGAVATTDTSLLAASAARTGWIVCNNTNKTMNLKYGTGASAVSLTLLLPPGATWPDPFRYTGAVNCFWPVGVVGSAEVTSLSP